MNPNARRQLKDIQVRAERLISGNPTLEEIEEFDQYNEELKKYLVNNLQDDDLIDRVRKIPNILDESKEQVAATGFLSALLAMFASGLVAYFQERKQVENAKDAIREARGAYASLEFFTKNIG